MRAQQAGELSCCSPSLGSLATVGPQDQQAPIRNHGTPCGPSCGHLCSYGFRAAAHSSKKIGHTAELGEHFLCDNKSERGICSVPYIKSCARSRLISVADGPSIGGRADSVNRVARIGASNLLRPRSGCARGIPATQVVEEDRVGPIRLDLDVRVVRALLSNIFESEILRLSRYFGNLFQILVKSNQ